MAAAAGGFLPAILLAQAGSGGSTSADLRDKVIVSVVTAILVLILSEPIKALLKKIGTGFGRLFDGLGWRFRKRYPEALAEKHRWLKLIGVYNSADLHPPRLQEVYVSLRVAAAKEEDGLRFAWSEIFQPDEKRLVILGSPGAGKTTLLDYLVLVFTGHLRHVLRERLGKPFPLYARLRELGTEGAESLTALLGRTPLEKIPADFPERWLRRGQCVVLLDGLDEVLDEERHVKAIDEIERLVAEYPDNHYVITCRIAGWRNQLPGFRTYEVQPFTGDDIRQFIGSWYREVLRTQSVNRLGANPPLERLKSAEAEAMAEAAEQTESLWQALTAQESLLRIAGTPLLLSLITLVHFHRQTDLPRGRAKLYEQCVEILLDLWDRQDKRLRLPTVPSLKEKRMVLEAIAFHFLKEGLLEADLAILRPIVEPLLLRIQATVTAEGLIRQIWQRSGILHEQRLGWFGFAHRALHDFLAAAYVVEHELDDLLLERAGEERWREVILIAAGLAPAARAQRLVGALLTRKSESAAELEMAGLTLAEDLQLGTDLRAEVRRRLLERLTQEEIAGPFRRLAGALMAADLEAAREWMQEELCGRDPRRQKRVLEFLPDLEETQARPLTALLLRLGGDLHVRVRAFQALAGLKVPIDAEVLRALREAWQVNEPALKAAAAWAWCELGRPEDLGFVKISAGEFLMGSPEGYTDERPQHSLYLPTFYMGKYPVTGYAFREFLEGTGYVASRWLESTPDHPVVQVSWYDALEYAEWHGFGLPSEAEWEKAARGTDGRKYPWGNERREGHANIMESWGPARRLRLRFPGSRATRGTTTPVGSFSPRGDSPYGCADMAGNVWEWTRSLWGGYLQKPSFHYPYVAGDGREDFQAPSGVLRVVRGGSCLDGSWLARCAFRNRLVPDVHDDLIGFRVVVLPFSSDL